MAKYQSIEQIVLLLESHARFVFVAVIECDRIELLQLLSVLMTHCKRGRFHNITLFGFALCFTFCSFIKK